MVDNSLLLLAVKRSMAIGAGNVVKGNGFNTYHSYSECSVDQIADDMMTDYLNYLIEECTNKLSGNALAYKSQIVESLEIDRDFKTYQWGEATETVCNSFYCDNNGLMSFFVYSLNPLGNGDTIQCENMDIQVKFRLADVAVTLTHTKKRRFGGSRTWREIRYIKPSVSFNDFVNALVIAVSPLLTNFLPVQTPTSIKDELVAQAKQIPDTLPSDAPRRTIYNPMSKQYVVVTAPEVLKLLPARWEYVSSEDVVPSSTNSHQWEFDTPRVNKHKWEFDQ